MPIATNPDTGEVVYLDDSGGWKPAQTAVNPQTREMMAFDGKYWQKVTTHGHGLVGYIDDAVRAVASGMTFGYADKIAAKMDELTGRGGSYEQNIKKERARTEAIPSAIRIPGEIAGGVASTVAAAPAAGAVGAATNISKLPALVKAVLSGAGVGAIYGAGTTDTGIKDTAINAATGAGVGAVTGPALLGAGRVLQHLRNPAGRAEAEIQRAIVRDSGISGSVPAGREGMATLADVGGENVKGLLERVAQTPGAGRTTIVPVLTERQTGQLSRISEDLKTLTGTKGNALEAVDQQMVARTQNAKPLYEQAFAEGDKPIWSKELERLSAVPEVQEAMHGAVKGWQRTQIANGYGAMNPGAMIDEKSGGLLKFLNGKVPVFPNLQFWDYTKNAIDNMIEKEIKPDGSITKRGRELTIIVDKLRGELDAAAPTYKAARDAWGGPSSYIKSINMGKGFRSMSAEEMSAVFNKLGDSEKEAFRIGAISDLIGKLGNKSARLADITNDLRSPEMRGKISALMPNAQAAAKWHKILEFESGSSEMVGRALKGSPTARRLFEAQDAGSIVGDMAKDMVTTPNSISLANLFTKVSSATYGKVRDTIRSKTDEEIAKRLTQSPGLLGKSPLQP